MKTIINNDTAIYERIRKEDAKVLIWKPICNGQNYDRAGFGFSFRKVPLTHKLGFTADSDSNRPTFEVYYYGRFVGTIWPAHTSYLNDTIKRSNWGFAAAGHDYRNDVIVRSSSLATLKKLAQVAVREEMKTKSDWIAYSNRNKG